MKYKAGDKVKIKSLEWYNENKNKYDEVDCNKTVFIPLMKRYCGSTVTIVEVMPIIGVYRIKEDDFNYNWTDEMIEGLVEEEGEETSWKPSKEEMDVLYGLAYITNKYDEHKEEVIARLYQDLKQEFFNGSSYENMFPNTENDVRRRSTIQVLEYARSLDNYNQYGKADIDKNIAWLERYKNPKELLDIPTMTTDFVKEHGLPCPEKYVFKDENGNIINTTKIVLEKKKPKYPTTYEECCNVLDIKYGMTIDLPLSYTPIIYKFTQLLICRDAYWKIAGEEMGLGKPWAPDWMNYNEYKSVIGVFENEIIKCYNTLAQYVLAFPTEEMRDAFYDNFKDLIEQCKELL